MRLLTVLFLTTLVCYTTCHHLVAGYTGDGVVLAHTERVQYNAIPFFKRVKQYFYTAPAGVDRKIAGIRAMDNLLSDASVNITSGGIGHSFVNFRLKSERGLGLDYDIAIYEANKY